jgi:prolyl-tRNA synthetase
MMGALVMAHGDDKGLVLPPRISPLQCVIVPIYSDKEKEKVLKYCSKIIKELESVKLDDRENMSPGAKFNEWEKKGIPLRIEIGPKDMSKNGATVVRRDTGEKEFVKVRKLKGRVDILLNEIQNNLYDSALRRLKENTHRVETYDEFKEVMKNKKGFVKAHWCGDKKCEEQIKYDTKATTRCLTGDGIGNNGKCIVCGKESKDEWTFAVSY